MSSFRFTDKLSETGFSYIPFSLFPVSPIINILSQCGTFVTIDETILRHYYELKSTVHFRVHSLYCTFYGFNKYIMTCTYHYCIIQTVHACSVSSDSLDLMDCSLPGSSVHRIFQARIGVGCYLLLQGIFPIQGSNLHLHWQTDSLPQSCLGSPIIQNSFTK